MRIAFDRVYRTPEHIQVERDWITRARLIPLLAICLLVLVVGLALAFTQSGGWSLVGFLLVPLATVAAIISYASVEQRRRELTAQLEESKARDQAMHGRNKKRDTTDYFDKVVQINILNLERYYGLVKRHTDNAFFVALFVGVAGFLLIASGLAIGFTRDDNSERMVGYIATGSGVITEFISGVFFYLYNRTTRQLKEYHDSLLDVQDLLLSFRIVGDSGEKDRPRMMTLMLETLLRPKRFRTIAAPDASVTH